MAGRWDEVECEEQQYSATNSCLRCLTLLFSLVLLLSSIVLMSFGAYLLQKWLVDDATMALPVPNYIWLVLGLGGAGSVANTLSACGACCRSLCLLSCSATISETLLVWQVLLASLLFFNPAAVDTEVCPPEDQPCLDKVDNIFKDPSSHAGVAVATVCLVQACALGLLFCFRSSSHRLMAQRQVERAVALALCKRGHRRYASDRDRGRDSSSPTRDPLLPQESGMSL